MKIEQVLTLASAFVFSLTTSANESVWIAKGESLASPFSKDDQKGAINLITPQSTKRALNLVKTGEIISLGVPLDRSTPAYGWRSFQLIVSQNEGTAHSNNEDVIFAPINTGTQIDGLAHIGINGREGSC
jgi:hypothetical protein